MEAIIRSSFDQSEIIDPVVVQKVAKGCYDLIGPKGGIIFPVAWETLVKPGWIITMHMWSTLEEDEHNLFDNYFDPRMMRKGEQ